MTDKEIVERAKEAEKRTGFGELVHSTISKGVNSAYGIGFIEGMIEYRNSMQEEPSKFDAAIQEGDDVRYNEDLGCRVNLSQLKRVAKKEEPVSKGLEEAATLYAKEEYSRRNPATLPNRCIGCYAPLMCAFKAGAKWQKTKDEEEKVLTYKHGFEDCKEQLMTKAVETTFDVSLPSGLYDKLF